MGQTVRYDVGNVFNPAYTVICRMPVSVIEASRGREGIGI
jgi:amidase